MTRHFCDVCGNELTPERKPTNKNDTAQVGDRLGGAHGALRFEIMTGNADGWNNAEFCKYCIIDAVNRHDDRAKVLPDSAGPLRRELREALIQSERAGELGDTLRDKLAAILDRS